MVLAVTWAVVLWRENRKGWRLFNAFLGMVVLGPVPLALVWALNYGYLPVQSSGYIIALPVLLLVVILVAFIGDVFNL